MNRSSRLLSITARRGFTLIELLVVVAIIALLMGILIPSLSHAREQARTVICGTHLRQWGVGVELYADTNNGCMPAKGGDGSAPPPTSNMVGVWNDSSLWFNAIPDQFSQKLGYWDMYVLSKYYPPNRGTGPDLPGPGASHIFVCPSAGPAEGVTVNAQGGPPDATQGPFFIQYGGDPSGRTSPNTGLALPTYICYNWNSKMSAGDPTLTDMQINQATLKFTQLLKSPTLILMSEKRMRQDELPPDDHDNPVMAATGGAITYNNYYRTLCQFKGMWSRFSPRHFGKGSVVFIDGHVELISYRDINTPSVYPGGSNSNSTGDWNQPGKWIWNPLFPAN